MSNWQVENLILMYTLYMRRNVFKKPQGSPLDLFQAEEKTCLSRMTENIHRHFKSLQSVHPDSVILSDSCDEPVWSQTWSPHSTFHTKLFKITHTHTPTQHNYQPVHNNNVILQIIMLSCTDTKAHVFLLADRLSLLFKAFFVRVFLLPAKHQILMRNTFLWKSSQKSDVQGFVCACVCLRVCKHDLEMCWHMPIHCFVKLQQRSVTSKTEFKQYVQRRLSHQVLCCRKTAGKKKNSYCICKCLKM